MGPVDGIAELTTLSVTSVLEAPLSWLARYGTSNMPSLRHPGNVGFWKERPGPGIAATQRKANTRGEASRDRCRGLVAVALEKCGLFASRAQGPSNLHPTRSCVGRHPRSKESSQVKRLTSSARGRSQAAAAWLQGVANGTSDKRPLAVYPSRGDRRSGSLFTNGDESCRKHFVFYSPSTSQSMFMGPQRRPNVASSAKPVEAWWEAPASWRSQNALERRAIGASGCQVSLIRSERPGSSSRATATREARFGRVADLGDSFVSPPDFPYPLENRCTAQRPFAGARSISSIGKPRCIGAAYFEDLHPFQTLRHPRPSLPRSWSGSILELITTIGELQAMLHRSAHAVLFQQTQASLVSNLGLWTRVYTDPHYGIFTWLTDVAPVSEDPVVQALSGEVLLAGIDLQACQRVSELSVVRLGGHVTDAAQPDKTQSTDGHKALPGCRAMKLVVWPMWPMRPLTRDLLQSSRLGNEYDVRRMESSRSTQSSLHKPRKHGPPEMVSEMPVILVLYIATHSGLVDIPAPRSVANPVERHVDQVIYARIWASYIAALLMNNLLTMAPGSWKRQ
ncbi:uncharacterized protein C8Q71DRAFT_872425 [Rhodofomes roseus]|uniref:Uncharacterized protein n=1 Tax=Rhodofomes roseus TaxID=34475 RepID=A0ABQ8KA98_9APHY|nr:uncharacterized protein C8Q71DRAFT_872425 [Rhodofomes roseus]KAH9834436.1 hypothetical protein C8Q71DRAFT_872425 [Rhodofomes roseus]